MTKVMLSCGHAANATDGNGQPSCAICAGLHQSVPVDAPNLTGRYARCGCGRTAPSTLDGSLAFFEFRGEGSRSALDICRNCSYAENAHKPEVMKRNNALDCHSFEPHGAFEFDNFYCGCRGWS
jgi:hypothetical protein